MIPKFRMWNRTKKEMFSVLEIDFKNKLAADETYWGAHFFDEIELMQSTSFFDKNGKEIFDGDLVKVIDTSTFGGTFIGEIVFLPVFGLYGFNMLDTKVLETKDFPKDSRGFVMRMFGNCFTLAEANLQKEKYTVEVIGNVWENKELLEEE